MGPGFLYERVYCARGDMENRVKEQQLGMFADRTSTATMHANQLRLYFSSVAYMLMQALRRLGLQGTTLASAQCTTIRLKLLKVGAQVQVTVRRVWFRMASGHAYAEPFAHAFSKNPCDALLNQTLPTKVRSHSKGYVRPESRNLSALRATVRFLL